MIKNILFDMGGVVLKWAPQYFIQRAGVTDREDRQLLFREVYGSMEWVQLDRGIITDDDMIKAALSRIPERLHEKTISLITHWDEDREEIDGMYELVEALEKKGYVNYLFTNASLRHREYFPRYRVSRFFEGRIMRSSDWHLNKPEHEFYEKGLEIFSLKAEECLFIDDNPANCEAAVYLGIPSIVFYGDCERLKRDMRTFGIDI